MRSTIADDIKTGLVSIAVVLFLAACFLAFGTIVEDSGRDDGRRLECERQHPDAVECIKIDGWWEPVVVAP